MLICHAAPGLGLAGPEPIARKLTAYLNGEGLARMSGLRGGASGEIISFFRSHDVSYRIRRLRLLARRLSQDWEDDADVDEASRDRAREAVYAAQSLYFDREPAASLGGDFSLIAAQVMEDPGAVLDAIAERRQLKETDRLADALLASAMSEMPVALRRRVLLGYLGFPFYDTATLPLLRGEGSTEFDPIKVDRISPDDCSSIRSGGTQTTLRGIEFYNFGAFFSRAYRENDYLWGRLHGAERMIDLVVSALPESATLPPEEVQALKHEAFLSILDEEESRLKTDPTLVPGLRNEILGKGTG
jgi:patatin-related protein